MNLSVLENWLWSDIKFHVMLGDLLQHDVQNLNIANIALQLHC